jgi:hypothetical protein
MPTSDINNSTMGSIGTESFNKLSDTPVPTSRGGGNLLNFLFGNEELNVLLKALKEGEFEAASFMIRNNVSNDFTATDPACGYTALHYVVAFATKVPQFDNVVSKILSSSDVSSFINIQDKLNGNTALHLAAYTKNYALCDMLVKAGANGSIRNNNKTYVLADSDVETTSTSVFVKKSSSKSNSPKSDSELDANMNNFVKLFVGLNQKKVRKSETDSGLMPNAFTVGQTDKQASEKVYNTDVFVDDLLKLYGDKANTNTVNTMNGGASNILVGKRQMKTYSDFSLDSEQSEQSGGDKESSELHEKAVSKIKGMLDEIDPKNAKKTTEEREKLARNYKAALYRKVNEPGVKNTEKAQKMFDLVTLANLKAIDIVQVTSEINKHLATLSSEKSKSTVSSKSGSTKSKPAPSKSGKAALSRTSDVSFTETDYSPTSQSN